MCNQHKLIIPLCNFGYFGSGMPRVQLFQWFGIHWNSCLPQDEHSRVPFTLKTANTMQADILKEVLCVIQLEAPLPQSENSQVKMVIKMPVLKMLKKVNRYMKCSSEISLSCSDCSHRWRSSLSLPPLAVHVMTPAHNVWGRHSPLVFVFSAALGFHHIWT